MTDRVSAGASSQELIAISSPGSLMQKPYFWREQKQFGLIILLGLAAIFILAPYTYKFAEGWVFLTIAVQLIAVWGAIISAKALATVEVETALAREIDRNASSLLREIKAKARPRIDLDEMEQKIAPRNPTAPPLAMIRLFQHICKEARDRKFESIVNVTQSYREEPLEDIFRLQNLQKIALWLGILGTFIGLLLAIQAGNLENVKGDQSFLEVVKQMFNSLFISFSASLAGLEVAVILGFFLLLLRKKQETYFKEMENAAITALSLARNSINKDEFLAEFNQIKESITDLNDKVYDQTQGLHDTRTDIQEQTKQIQNGIGKLSEAKGQLDGFLHNVSQAQANFISEVTRLYDVISLKQLGTSLEQSILQAGTHISAVIDPKVTGIARQLEEFNKSILALGHMVNRQTKSTSETEQKVEKQVRELTVELKKLVAQNTSQIVALGDRLARAEESSSRLLRDDLKELSRNLSRLNDSLSRSGSSPYRRRGIWNRLRGFWDDLR